MDIEWKKTGSGQYSYGEFEIMTHTADLGKRGTLVRTVILSGGNQSSCSVVLVPNVPDAEGKRDA